MTYNKGNKITSKEALKYLLADSEELYTEYEEEKFYLEAVELYNIVLKDLEILEIIKKHKLLNYVLKNEKCANMYHLSKEEIDLLRELMK